MTKAQEIEALNKFYAGLPEDSYLREILKGIPERTAVQIQNDFCIPLLAPDAELRAAMEAEELRQLRAAVQEVARQNQSLKAQLKEAHEHVYVLSSQMMQLKAKLYDLLYAGR